MLAQLLLLLCAVAPTAGGGAPAPEPAAAAAKRIPPGRAAPDESLLQRIAALEGGAGQDYYGRHEAAGLRHARAMAELPEQERLQLELALLRDKARAVRDEQHGGNTEEFFERLDHSGDDHLQTEELLSILHGLSGDPQRQRPDGTGVFGKIADQMVDSVRAGIDQDGDGVVHRSEFADMMHGGDF